MSKILIMVLSYNVSPYKELMEAQKSTWDYVDVEDVTTVYYYGGLPYESHHDDMTTYPILRSSYSREVQFKCTDLYYLMAHKLKLALEYVKDWEYDFIFRTNSSSYCQKNKLKEFSQTLPTEKLYSGWEFIDSEDFGGGCISGAGIWLSRDTAEILRNEIDPNKELEEDVYIGRILRKHGIEAIDDKSRIDWPEEDKDIHTAYHIRFKGPHGNRYRDADDMRFVHRKIIENT